MTFYNFFLLFNKALKISRKKCRKKEKKNWLRPGFEPTTPQISQTTHFSEEIASEMHNFNWL